MPKGYYPHRSRGPMPQETRDKISAAQKGRPLKPEHVAKLKLAVRQPVSKEQREKMRSSLKGRIFSVEHREKLRLVAKGRIHSPETRAKMSAAQKERIARDGHRMTAKCQAAGRNARRTTPELKQLAAFMRDCCHRVGAIQTTRFTMAEKNAILGYTRQQLKEHLEKLFMSGINWTNYGQWHVDHIKPVAWFIRNGITDPRVVNALSNLQPLWKSENHRKHAKVIA